MVETSTPIKLKETVWPLTDVEVKLDETAKLGDDAWVGTIKEGLQFATILIEG